MSYNIYLEGTDNVIGMWPSKELLPGEGEVIELEVQSNTDRYEVTQAEVGPILVGNSAIMGHIYVKPVKQ